MSHYKLVTGVFFPSADDGKGGKGVSYPAGQVLDIDDQAAKAYVDRGSMVAYDPEAEAEAAKPKSVEGEVVKEFVLNDFEYKMVDTSEGFKFTLNGDLIEQNAFENAWQQVVREELEAKRAEEQAAKEEKVDEAHATDDPAVIAAQIQSDPQVNEPQGGFVNNLVNKFK